MCDIFTRPYSFFSDYYNTILQNFYYNEYPIVPLLQYCYHSTQTPKDKGTHTGVCNLHMVMCHSHVPFFQLLQSCAKVILLQYYQTPERHNGTLTDMYTLHTGMCHSHMTVCHQCPFYQLL